MPASSFSCSADRQERRPGLPACRRPDRSRSTFRKTACCSKRAYWPANRPFPTKVRTTNLGPFGEVIRATGPMAKANPFRFSTKYQDDETDLLYYGYRFYSASMGRWLNTDPIEEQGGKNLRCFVGNQPITQSDPLGLFSIDNQGVFTGNEVAQINRKVVDACTKRFDSLVNKDCTLYPCIKKKCQSGTITLSSDTPKQNTQGQMIPTLGRAGDTMRNIAGWGNDVTLYPKNGGPSTDWGGVAIHEWAHCCGWVHGESGLDPSISGSSM